MSAIYESKGVAAERNPNCFMATEGRCPMTCDHPQSKGYTRTCYPFRMHGGHWFWTRLQYSPCGRGFDALGTGLTYKQFVAADLELVERCDAILLLEGWKCSKGACEEHLTALSEQLTVYCGLEQVPDLTKEAA